VVHTHARSASRAACGVAHLQHQPGAVFNAAVIGVVALVGAVLHQPGEQVGIGSVGFQVAKTSAMGVLRATATALVDAWGSALLVAAG